MNDTRWDRRGGEATEVDLSSSSRPVEPSGSVVFFNYVRCQERATAAPAFAAGPIGALFNPKDVVLLTQAMDEACSFLRQFGKVGPAKRRQVALTILRHANDGMRDPHRLAIKGIVAVA